MVVDEHEQIIVGDDQEIIVSIIVLNYNGIKYIDDCLQSVFSSSFLKYEIICVDNGSTDGSIEIMRNYEGRKNFRLILNEENLGYAAGNNVGIRLAKGKYVILLNNDTKVAAGWLEPLIELMDKEPDLGACQSKLVIMNTNYLDSVGSFMNQYGFLVHVGLLEEDKNQFSEPFLIFGAKGASMILRKQALDRVGLFDEDFFMYFEETDLCWRIWLAGYKIKFVPTSVVYHAWGGATSISKMKRYLNVYLGFRNRVTSILKNVGTRNLIPLLLRHLVLSLGISVYFLKKGETDNAGFVLRALLWNMVNYPKIRKKRTHVQNTVRRVSDQDLFLQICKRQSISALYEYHTKHVAENLPKVAPRK